MEVKHLADQSRESVPWWCVSLNILCWISNRKKRKMHRLNFLNVPWLWYGVSQCCSCLSPWDLKTCLVLYLFTIPDNNHGTFPSSSAQLSASWTPETSETVSESRLDPGAACEGWWGFFPQSGFLRAHCSPLFPLPWSLISAVPALDFAVNLSVALNVLFPTASIIEPESIWVWYNLKYTFTTFTSPNLSASADLKARKVHFVQTLCPGVGSECWPTVAQAWTRSMRSVQESQLNGNSSSQNDLRETRAGNKDRHKMT